MGKASGKRITFNSISGLGREFGALTGLVLICVALSILKPDSFPQTNNIRNILTQVAPVAVIAAGMTLVIITGGIDLSVGSVLTFAACVGGYLVATLGVNTWLALFVVLAIGLLLGTFNGFMVTKIGLPPFIATLGTMGIARGLAYRITGGSTIYNIGDQFLYLGSKNIFGIIPAAVAAFVLVYIAGHILLTRTTIGRHVYAIGGSEDAAKLSGVPVDKVKIFTYAITGLLAGISGIILAGRVNAIAPQSGEGYELDVIAAVVIGGTSLSGGQGRMVGSIIGALIMGVVRNGLNLMLIDSNWQRVVIGFIIIFAVSIDALQKRGKVK